MLNRRLIRIKTFQAIFGEFGQESVRPATIVNNVKQSMRGMGQNLLAVLSFGPEFSHFILSERNPSEFKFQPSSEDKKSFALITENPFLQALKEEPEMDGYLARPTFDWQQEKDTMLLIFKEIKNSDEYAAAMSSSLSSQDYFEFTKFLYKYLLLDSVEFEQLMEDKNIFWYDEKIPILKSLEKVFTDYENTNRIKIPSLFRNESEDLQMAEDLVSQYFEHKSSLEESINKYTPGWDSDRITKIDYVLMMMALLEFKHMPMIPVKVTLNEYIEIAKMYSTPKSSKFLNGILDKILNDWKEQDLIHKKGRGLIG
ncbi:MAG: transcription antitermination factor NusB [Bacteroidetes bacterium]|nr:MAG: transcription antitermination factor NusB [Bacteroidota bacterium]